MTAVTCHRVGVSDITRRAYYGLMGLVVNLRNLINSRACHFMNAFPPRVECNWPCTLNGIISLGQCAFRMGKVGRMSVVDSSMSGSRGQRTKIDEYFKGCSKGVPQQFIVLHKILKLHEMSSNTHDILDWAFKGISMEPFLEPD